MAIDRRVSEAAKQVGGETRISPAVLLAVALVETRAVPFAQIDGQCEPLIRFEGHYFHKLLPETLRAEAVRRKLASPRAGRIGNPVSQAGRWALLRQAMEIDSESACASVSWGLCQVMGANARALGFGSAADLAETARESIAGQLRLGARFLSVNHLSQRLEDGDFRGFARRYNGTNYRRNGYDEKIAAAFERARSHLGDDPAGDLGRGVRGASVARLQSALRDVGSAIVIDAIFGPRTEAAIAAWQRATGLTPTGIADDATRRRLKL